MNVPLFFYLTIVQTGFIKNEFFSERDITYCEKSMTLDNILSFVIIS